jgi:hypothetical protein
MALVLLSIGLIILSAIPMGIINLAIWMLVLTCLMFYCFARMRKRLWLIPIGVWLWLMLTGAILSIYADVKRFEYNQEDVKKMEASMRALGSSVEKIATLTYWQTWQVAAPNGLWAPDEKQMRYEESLALRIAYKEVPINVWDYVLIVNVFRTHMRKNHAF